MQRKTLAVTSTTTVSLLLAVGLFGSTASAAPPSPSTPSHALVTLAEAPSWTAHATQLAAPAPAASISFTVTLDSAHQAAATAYATAVNDPGSPDYHKYLTAAQYGSVFGPSASSTTAVTSWLSGQGLTVTGQGDGYLQARGTVASVNSAFHTTIRSFKHGDRTVSAPATAISVPASLGADVQSVTGLDTSPTASSDISTQADVQAKVAQLLGVTAPAASPTTTTNGCSTYAGQNQSPYLDPAPAPLKGRLPNPGCGYTASQLDSARGVTGTGLTGKNVRVGVVLWCDDPSLVSDVNHWASDTGVKQLKSGQVTTVEPPLPFSSYCTTQGAADQDETALDTESIHGAAPAASITYAPATGPTDAELIPALHRLVDTDSVDIISNSWGELESELTPDVQAAYDAVFTQAAAEGISVLASSGDASDNFDTAAHPNFPASDPWITSVGGTSLGIGASGKKTFEQSWFTAISVETKSAWSAWRYASGAGGGTSALFPQPYYQKGVVPTSLAGTTPKRVYPDIANIADPTNGYLIGFTDTLGNFVMEGIGGTSLASPYTAGQLALAVQQTGRRAGFLNPAIYRHGSRDLTDLSSNKVDHGVQAAEAILGYSVPVTFADNGQSLVPTTLSVAPGYDNLSGMGVPDDEAKFIALVSAG